MNAPPVEELIARWRDFLRRRPAVSGPDAEELEGHLRERIAALTEAGLTPDEAFLVAIKRMGALDEISREFAREHSERLWKQLVSPPPAEAAGREPLVALGIAVLAAALIKLPSLFGLGFDDAGGHFYARNMSLFLFPGVAAFLAWKRELSRRTILLLGGGFALVALAANLWPFQPGGDTEVLFVFHAPIAAWLLVGIAYAGGRWFAGGARMDFVRFSGELFIYLVLIGLGGMVFTAVTVLSFEAIGVDAEWLIGNWIVPCGVAGAIVVASGLVEMKKSVVENMAPVLARIFTPLFTLALLAFLATGLLTGNPVGIEREVLILFDAVLVLVAGLILYNVSARDPAAPPGLFDALALLLAVAALAADLLALGAILGRIGEFGFTPNRVAALGENLVLLVSLAGSAGFYARFLHSGRGFGALERWQMGYLLVYAGWGAVVATLFPLIFGFR